MYQIGVTKNWQIHVTFVFLDKMWYVPLDYLPRQKNIYYTYFDDPLKPRSLVYSACKRLVESQADKRIQPFYGT